MSRLVGKTVLITGASSGIGQASARLFAEAGAHLIITARRKQKLEELQAEIQKKQPKCTIHLASLDVRDQGAVAEVMRGLPEGLRNIDVLVNNAGLSMGLDKVEDVKLDAIDTLLDTNVRGAIFMMQAVVPGMRKRQTGHIINIGSVAGIQAYPGGGIYCASKHALNALTQSLRHELVDTPIRVSEVLPGMVDTEFSTVRFGGDKAKADAVYKGTEPLTAVDIAESIVFIASRPPHVAIAEMLIFPTCQSGAQMVARK